MAKKLIINCASCDARKVREETLAGYESATINAAVILTNSESREILNRHNVALNCADVVDVEGEVRLSTVNGAAEIRSTDELTENVYLIVNGKLSIGPDTGEVLKRYVGIQVNGTVEYPESVSAVLGGMTVNGSAVCYPDGAVVLKRSAVIDRTFALRAREGLYWSAKRMILVDPKLDPALLAKKGCTFSAKEFILAEGLAEAMMPMLDERAEMILVPDGTAVVLDDVTLSDTIVRKYGPKLYILGDLKVMEDGRDALERLEYLTVRGDATVQASMEALLLEKADQITGEVKVLERQSRILSDKTVAKISKWLLEREKVGLRVEDCAVVKIDADVPRELIVEKLTISDCAVVRCAPEQEDAVSFVSEDVQMIHTGEETEADALGNVGDIIRAALGRGDGNGDNKVINCASYVM